MAATTLDLVEAAIVTAIIGITPRHTLDQANSGWKHYKGERPPSADSRWFRIEWDTVGYTQGGFMGPRWVDTEVTMSIFVDYGGVPSHLVKLVAEDDHYQLRDVLNRLKASVDGLRWLEATDWDFANSDPNQRQIVHQYMVRYMKERG